MHSREQVILKTLLYADIFDYPLKEEEIFKFLISPKAIEKRLLFDRLKKPKSKIKLKNRYYFIKGKEDLVKKHITKEIVKDGFLGFHLFDYKTYILSAYEKNYKNIK